MPATWKEWGMGADGDGRADPYNSVDAIFSTARYLRANAAPRNYKHAIFAYNHADWYVKEVLGAATKYKSATVAAAAAVPKRPLSVQRLPRIQTVR